MTSLLLLKSLHIIGFVSWFAGLFYLVRMFVYQKESFAKPEPARTILTDQYHLMQVRVYSIICNPGLIITWICGLGMIYLYGWEWFKVSHWLHIKLVLLLAMTGYHLLCKKWINQLKNNQLNISSFQFRLLNEVPTLFLISIVVLAVYKNLTNFGIVFVSLLCFGILLFIAAKAYKKYRKVN